MKKLLLLFLPIAMISCSSDDSTPVETIPVTANAIAYIRGSVNGQSIDYSYTADFFTPSYYNYINGSYGVDPGRSFYYGGSFSPAASNTGRPALTISWNNMLTGSTGDENTAFYPAFETNVTNYITSEQEENRVKGVDVSYESEDGKNYSTLEGSQTGSTFTIATSEKGTEAVSGLKTQTITGTFSCKLYNYDNPAEIITITGGTYKVIVREFD